VSLTPRDIEQQVFKERFRGYDQDEVDRFLGTLRIQPSTT
jgi:DivIVA domain-containing protein